jgi:hypothetical protein
VVAFEGGDVRTYACAGLYGRGKSGLLTIAGAISLTWRRSISDRANIVDQLSRFMGS